MAQFDMEGSVLAHLPTAVKIEPSAPGGGDFVKHQQCQRQRTQQLQQGGQSGIERAIDRIGTGEVGQAVNQQAA